MNKPEVDRKISEKSFSKETKDFYRKFFSDTLSDRILYELAKFDHGGIFHQNVFLDWYISKWYPFHKEVAQDIENHSIIFSERYYPLITRYYPLITDVSIQYKNRFQKRIIEILQKKCHEKLRKNGLFGKIPKEKIDKIDFSRWHGWENNQQHYIDFGKQIFENFNVTHDLHREL